MNGHYFEFKNVSKSFDENDVLKDVSFYVEQGETAVIMGRSGVGKSVSLKLLLGFLQPDEGQIIVAGKNVTGWTEEQFSRDPAASDDGVSVGRAIRFADGGGKCGVSFGDAGRERRPEKIDATVQRASRRPGASRVRRSAACRI